MLRQQAKRYVIIQILIDVMSIILSFFVAYYLRQTSFIVSISAAEGPLFESGAYLWMLMIAIPLWLMLLKTYNAYEPQHTVSNFDIVWIIFKTVIVGMLTLGTVIYFLRYSYISRLFVLMFGSVNFLVLGAVRLSYKQVLKELRRRGYNSRTILVVGTGRRAREFAKIILSHSEWGLRIHGYVDDDPTDKDKELLGSAVVGRIKDIPDLIRKNVIDEVIIAIPRKWLDSLDEVVRICEEEGVETTILADLYDTVIAETHLSFLHDIPLLSFSTIPAQEWKLVIKTVVDLAVAALLLIMLAPLFIVISAAIKLTSEGPVFFKQVRYGLRGREFKIYKFRSMYLDAEKRMDEIRHLNEMSGPVFKIMRDPRVTPIGRFLRKTSLDELPQLINVLRGEMSLVGPRPPIPSEVKEYERWQRRRLSMKPGLTCLWQVKGRNRIEFERWMELDLQYIDNWSLGLDLKIILRTVPVVLFGYGAS
jgi:exopolysaccharide biosynthesis polyprenyl glycosylphosphotransferase